MSTVTRFFGRPKVLSSVVDRAESDVEAWTLPMELPLQEKDVGVVSITLDFHVGGGGTGLSLPEEAVRADALGLVRGISNGSLRVLACDKSEKLWSRDEAYRGAVLSIPAGTTGVEVDGTDVELAGVPGWACAFLPARREVACALSAGSRSASASLYREGFGMALILR